MALDRRAYNGAKDYIPVKGEAAASWQPVKPATIQERRIMKKGAQPEYSYTGCVPYTADEPDDVPKKKNPPILGYRGHLRNQDDRVGTTFTQGLTVASRGPEPILTRSDTKTQQPINQQHQVRFAEDKNQSSKPLAVVGAKGMSPRSGYEQFDNASGYGAFAPPPPAGGMSPRSGYGAFDNTSGYGCFASPPERDTGISPRSGYGAFDNASGYGNFAAPPDAMSPRSGYGTVPMSEFLIAFTKEF
ncbi:hypothetical protein BBJ29_003179 [Phytophthora kernoviae]|uniref:Uncharacterized protein n=1 Tax=Phytophthora kernoviae TaxID=325452 RepID=A0A3F2RS45_9STRA|nr:hypothetical protein BBJ29_003179 [Phytophthora kernoviae]RLN62151.1 hypothetical protein BBP00_00004955 [Phytophthora kernoviae]